MTLAKKQGAFNCRIEKITTLLGKNASFSHDEDGLRIECKNDSRLPVVFKVSIA